MCGIVGVWNATGEPVSQPLLRKMSALVAHRGPDGDGHFADGPVGFGHRRLAILDLSSAGHQPMSNEDGRVVVVHNGEIYNFAQLRMELEAVGHRFHSETDTEVVVHGWEEWGPGCVLRFNGMFAFAVWDRGARRLFLARDRYGVKPLYYYWDGKRLVFGSEMRSILAHPDVPRRLCLPAINEYFTFQNIITDRTFFEGVRMLPAGYTLTVDIAAAGEPSLAQYWDFPWDVEPLSISRADAAEELNRLFTQAVARQLVSDVPVGSYLSGGMDSGSITAVARQHLGRLATFTCGFDLSSASGLELAFDERKNAEELANLFKTEHYEVVLHAGDMEHVMPELIWHLEDLRVGQCYPNYYVARLASKFVKVVLSGAGGDELFAGYPWRYYRGMDSGKSEEFYLRYYNFWQRLVADDDKPRLFSPEFRQQAGGESPFEVFRCVLARGVPELLAGREDFVRASLYFELKTFLHGLLVVEDKISMSHGLETRVPFLDNDLVDFAMRVPVCYKLRSLAQPARVVDENEAGKQRRYELQTGDGKVVLRDAMSRLIPAAVTDRAKQGFSAPDASWFRGESIDYIQGLLNDPRARVFELLDERYVAERLREHASGHHNHRLFIWSVLSFEWWLRQFMPSGSAAAVS
jgi:asparagine synthase (glutamine-hydrolysing)